MGVTNQSERGWKTAKRKRIMETGFNIFSERGIEAVTMPEVAEASGVSRVTLYRYFPTKLDLVLAIGVDTWLEYIDSRTRLFPRRSWKSGRRRNSSAIFWIPLSTCTAIIVTYFASITT